MTAKLVQRSYATEGCHYPNPADAIFYTVECTEPCGLVLNSGHHYRESGKQHAEALAAAHNLTEHLNAARFLEQNDDFAADLTDEDREAVEAWAAHHAGGLYVLIRNLGGTRYVKAHDSWGDPKDGKVVVHVYDADADGEDPGEVVTYFDGGHAALTAFFAAE